MGVSKTKDIYRAFANRNRAKLILCLSKGRCVSELLVFCDLSQSALSQHLKILRDEGVASCERAGQKQIYIVRNKKILKIAKLLLEIDK